MFILQEILNQNDLTSSSYFKYRQALIDLKEPFEVVTFHDGKIQFLDNEYLPKDIDHEAYLKELTNKPFIPLGSVAFDNYFNAMPTNIFHNALLPYTTIRQIVPNRFFLNQRDAGALLTELTPTTDEFFLRPVEYDKALTGRKYTKEEFELLQLSRIKEPKDALINTAKFTMAPVQEVAIEARYFVVNHQLVSYSSYAKNSQYNDDVKPTYEMTAFAKDFIHHLSTYYRQVGTHYVVDVVALANHELRVVEFNPLQASGIYQADAKKIITALKGAL